jgi:arylsulfatase A-like enzyme
MASVLLRFRPFLLLLLLVGVVPRIAAGLRPNVLLILADDLGLGDLSCLNTNCAWKTPNLDRLAREGRVFTDAHSASSVCTPSRYALMTGRYAWRGRLKSGVLDGYDPALIEPRRPNLARFLQSHGYVTAMVGKWHLGLDWARKEEGREDVDFTRPFGGGPLALGFEMFHGISASLDMPPYVYLDGDRVPVPPDRRIEAGKAPAIWRAGVVAPDFVHAEVQARFLDQATAFLEARSRAADGRPFFLHLALASPHTPIVPTVGFAGRTQTTPYGDFVAELDASVGRLLDRLDRTGQTTNTLLFFTADNGCSPAADLAALARHHHDPSAGFRGHKADLFEGGHRVPLIARWPGHIPPGTRCAATVGQVDFLATIAEALGRAISRQVGVDGVSFLPQLLGTNTTPTGRDGLVHHSINGSFALRDGRWKLLLAPDSGGWSAPRPGDAGNAGLPRFQLYDLEADPAERTNQVEQHPEIVRRLGLALRRIVERGRSTAGPDQTNDLSQPWPQIGWTTEFVP